MTIEKPAQQSGTYLLGGDLKVFRLGFGAMRVTGPGIWGEPKNHAEAIALLHHVPDLGINFIDTADSYGPYISEKIIAEALYPYPDHFIIATKGGIERPAPSEWVPNGNPKHLRKACETSLKHLKLERIDLYQLHTIDPHFPLEEQIGVLYDLQQEGKIRHIGLSNVNVGEIKKARTMIKVASVQNKYNLLERQSEEVLNYCNQENIAFIPWFPLATGGLAKSGNILTTIADKLKAHPSQVALAWLLKKAKVMIPIPGTSNIKHLEENTKAALLTLDESMMKALDEIGI